jgi:uncharacterized protein (DUF433 family)
VSEDELFESRPDVVSGALVFKGTRIPVDALFENLAAGLSLEEVLEDFPGIGRERAEAAILLAARHFHRDAA